MIDAIKGKDEKKILKIVDTVFDKGYDMEEFVSGYMKHLRKIFLLKNGVEIKDLSSEELEKYVERKDIFSSFLLLQMLNRLSLLTLKMKKSAITRILLELELLTLARLEDTVQIKELLQRIEKMNEGVTVDNIREENYNYEINNETETANKTRDESLETIWNQLVGKVAEERRQLAGIRENFTPLSLEKGLCTIRINNPNGFIIDELEQKGGQKLIEDVLTSITGEKIKVRFVEKNRKSVKEKKTTKSKKNSLKENEMIKKAQEILKAKIVNPNKD